MKILYCNPSFWDYRLPFYQRLNELFKGEFFVMFSSRRYYGREKLLDKIKRVLGKNAIPYENELIFDVQTRSFNNYSEGRIIPFPFGLLRPDTQSATGCADNRGFLSVDSFGGIVWFFVSGFCIHGL